MREIKYQYWYGGKMIEVGSIQFMTDGSYIVNDELVGGKLREYTGLTDTNGKEIYEGDLFGKLGGDQESPDEYEIHGQVKFDSDFAMFVIELTNGGWMELFDYMNQPKSEKEVIGNIYENPELMEAKK